jgi:hypothetical protein
MMRYCHVCPLATDTPACPQCGTPTTSWPFALTGNDEQFLRETRIAVDDHPTVPSADRDDAAA